MASSWIKHWSLHHCPSRSGIPPHITCQDAMMVDAMLLCWRMCALLCWMYLFMASNLASGPICSTGNRVVCVWNSHCCRRVIHLSFEGENSNQFKDHNHSETGANINSDQIDDVAVNKKISMVSKSYIALTYWFIVIMLNSYQQIDEENTYFDIHPWQPADISGNDWGAIKGSTYIHRHYDCGVGNASKM